MDNYTPVIGLEIHVELMTKSKMFCQCSADYFTKDPNTHVCPVCLGMPGGLPVPNKTAIEWTILIGKALNCEINLVSKFDRKHYFYPDLAKGYQISQYDEPLAVKGFLEIEGKKFRIHRVHLEEDTGKLIHQGADTLVDFNRSGVPLVEIVTEPDFTSADEVKKFGEELRAIIRALKVSDADMEKGSMRLEPNISVRKPGEETLPKYKVEVKNINSFNFVKKAIEYEVVRHIEILKTDKMPEQETRGYNEDKGITVGQRSKEEAHDYRYFPEPDIPPLRFTNGQVDEIVKNMPELPHDKRKRYESEGVSASAAYILSVNAKIGIRYQELINTLKDSGLPNLKAGVANLLVNKRIDSSKSIEENVEEVKQQLAPKETDMALLDDVITKVLAENEKVVQDFKSGKQNAIMFLVGQVMRAMKGQADAATVRGALELKIK
jgi:aspartyl-tRNA(Asn)/glutamyl-tRNA(Gln) amidotransferase subunit B